MLLLPVAYGRKQTKARSLLTTGFQYFGQNKNPMRIGFLFW